jgi:hypothetical protein
MINHAPAYIQGQLTTGLNHLSRQMQVIFSNGIDRVFLFSTVFMLLALVMGLFLPQIPLRKKQNSRSPGTASK